MHRHDVSPTLKNFGNVPDEKSLKESVIVNCGWGRLLFANTFSHLGLLAQEMQKEKVGDRDIAFYVRDPNLVIAESPNTLFLDPSSAYRLELSKMNGININPNISVRRMTINDLDDVNTIYEKANMVQISKSQIHYVHQQQGVHYWVAYTNDTHQICSACLILDHKTLFNDPDDGVSLWSLAVNIHSSVSKIGISMMQQLIQIYSEKRRKYLDISVLQDNKDAISLYTKLGFKRTGVFCVKKKNAINEKLFVPEHNYTKLNPYSQIIVDEALHRGISIQLIDEDNGIIDYSFGGRKVRCWESLSELTSAVSLTQCQNKHLTHRILQSAGLHTPHHQLIHHFSDAEQFLNTHKSIVVKPNNGEQGHGVSLNIQTHSSLHHAVQQAQKICSRLLLETFVEGIDLRIVVINYEVIAAAIRRPPEVTGDGILSIEDLIKKQSRRRESMTGGESKIPIDSETTASLNNIGYHLSDILDSGETITVRKTANLHQGGTIHDVTNLIHQNLKTVAVKAARSLNIPVVGLDFIIQSIDQPNYVIIEANERPGLANHEPQPTAEKFIDLLFPNCPRRHM